MPANPRHRMSATRVRGAWAAAETGSPAHSGSRRSRVATAGHFVSRERRQRERRFQDPRGGDQVTDRPLERGHRRRRGAEDAYGSPSPPKCRIGACRCRAPRSCRCRRARVPRRRAPARSRARGRRRRRGSPSGPALRTRIRRPGSRPAPARRAPRRSPRSRGSARRRPRRRGCRRAGRRTAAASRSPAVPADGSRASSAARSACRARRRRRDRPRRCGAPRTLR